MEPLAKQMDFRACIFDDQDHDPTAERLSEQLFNKLKEVFSKYSFELEYVTVYENENSKATYSKD